MLSADTIFDLMRNVSKTSGTTFLIATHDPRLAKHCDRIIDLVDGRIDSNKPNAATHSGQKIDDTAPSPTLAGALLHRRCSLKKRS